jgi:hypothetical protein
MPHVDDELQEDLDATSESLEADARRLVRIESEKQHLERGDQRLAALSIEAERLAGDIQHKSSIERDLSGSPSGAKLKPSRPS